MATTQARIESTTVGETHRAAPLGRIYYAALGLAAITAVIHLYLYVTVSWIPFLVAGAGYVAAIGLVVLLDGLRRPIYLAVILFTIGQIVGYLLFPMGDLWLAVLDKAVQVALILALGYLVVVGDDRSTVSGPDAATEGLRGDVR